MKQLLAMMLLVPVLGLNAQNVSNLPAFEVASVKLNKSGRGPAGPPMQPGGRFTLPNQTLRTLVRNAYGLQDVQISGGPSWINTDRFDITAKAEGNPPTPQMWLMVRTLLQERFKLRVHTETRELPIYALVMARSDRRLGSQLRSRPEGGCDSRPQAVLPDSKSPNQCGRLGAGLGSLNFRGVTMEAVAKLGLGPRVDRLVFDRTGLSGIFDVDLEWTPEAEPFVSAAALPPGLPVPPPPSTSGPSLFTALQEQLGLKLESARGRGEVLVIDSVERPTPD